MVAAVSARPGTAGHDGYVKGGVIAPGSVVKIDEGEEFRIVSGTGETVLMYRTDPVEWQRCVMPDCHRLNRVGGIPHGHSEGSNDPSPAPIVSDPDLLDTVGGRPRPRPAPPRKPCPCGECDGTHTFEAWWIRTLHPFMRHVLGPRAFAAWCLWRYARTRGIPDPPLTTNPPRTVGGGTFARHHEWVAGRPPNPSRGARRGTQDSGPR